MHKFRSLFFAWLAVTLGVGALSFLIQGAASVRTPEELDYGEGIVLWQAAHVTNWAAAYHPVEIYPHIVFHYPPVFHLASRAAAAALRIDLLAAGRLTSVLSLIGVCLVLGFLAWHALENRTDRAARSIGAFSAATLIFTLPVWTWACLMRVDTVAMVLSFSGIALFIFSKRRPWLAFAAFVCFVLAVYTKQTMIAAPIACLLVAWMESRRLALGLAAFILLTGLAVLALLQAATHGLFIKHILSYNQNPFSPKLLMTSELDHLALVVAVLSMAVVLPALMIFRPALRVRPILTRPFERTVLVTGLYLLLAAMVTLTTGKEGSNYNYFFEMDLAACLLAGLFLGWLLRVRALRRGRPFATLACLVIPLVSLHTAQTIRLPSRAIYALRKPVPAEWRDAVTFVQTLPGPVYSENMTLLMAAGKELPAEPAIITMLARTGQWDESGFIGRIRSGQFDAIVIETTFGDRERFTPHIAEAINRSYAINRTFGMYKIYRFRQ